jgi:hypothetical protein
MAGVNWSWQGLDSLLSKLANYPEFLKQGLASALFVEGQELIGEAKQEVPVRYGHLRDSGFSTIPEEDNNGALVVTAGFGGPAGTGNQEGETNDEDVGYAIYVHENLEAHHEVGKAKFLEDPFNARKEGIPERLAERSKNYDPLQ